ncbi:MAG: metalloregulator ArsR/SmtB family transcription factor [Bacteroidales bacterium]|nr:metalloregulator ArsR/SmtB family transcription factor [Bacteroidales bacterium]
MAIAKTMLFNDELQKNAELFKALAHPARLAILKYLAETRTCINGDFAYELPLSRTTVNQHLTELKNAGLILWHTSGVKTYYCLNQKKISELGEIAKALIDELTIPEDTCCQP